MTITSSSSSSRETQDASATEPSPDASGEEVADFLRDFVSGFRGTIRAAANRAGDIDPPDQVETPHNELVAALESAADEFDAVSDALPDALTLGELEQADATFFSSAELNAAFEAISATCNALQQIATDNNIDVDLECDE